MNREIEFRAWDKYIKKMYPVVDITFDIFKEHIFNVSLRLDDGFSVSYTKCHEDAECDVGALILLQYTGLKDKNGTKIFEGDILKNYGNEIEDWIVSYEYGKFIGTFDDVCEDLYELSDLEVIGNIYESEMKGL